MSDCIQSPIQQVLGSDSFDWVAAGSIAPTGIASAGVVDQDNICVASTGDEQFMFVQNNCTEVRRACARVRCSRARSWLQTLLL